MQVTHGTIELLFAFVPRTFCDEHAATVQEKRLMSAGY